MSPVPQYLRPVDPRRETELKAFLPPAAKGRSLRHFPVEACFTRIGDFAETLQHALGACFKRLSFFFLRV